MKISKDKLKKIVKEELAKSKKGINEAYQSPSSIIKAAGLKKMHKGMLKGDKFMIGIQRDLSKGYKQGYFDGSSNSWGTNSRSVEGQTSNPDYRQGFEDASGYNANEVEMAINKADQEKRKASAARDKEKAAAAKRYSEKGKFSDLSGEEQTQIKKDFDAMGVDGKRFIRKSTPTQTDFVYGRTGRRGSSSTTVYDSKYNVLIPFGKTGGSGGSLGT